MPSTITGAAPRAWAEAFDFNGRGVTPLRIDAAAASMPTQVRRALAFYSSWQENDLGNARLLKTTVGGATVFALHTTTDGDDGFLELFDARGRLMATGETGATPGVRWDAVLGAVRERVVPVTDAIDEFFEAVEQATGASTPIGSTVNVVEARTAAESLLGGEPTNRSIDGFETSAMLKVMADAELTFTQGARNHLEQLIELHAPGGRGNLTRLAQQPHEGDSLWAQPVRLASATVPARSRPPGVVALNELSQRAFGALASHLKPVTRTDAMAMLQDTGASAAEAKATVAQVLTTDGQLVAGRLFTDADDHAPRFAGLGLFSVSADGAALKAVMVPTASVEPEPRAVLASVLGVDRALEVIQQRGETYRLRWRPPMGGTLEAEVDITATGEAEVASVSLPAVLEAGLASNLEARLTAALGAPQKVLGWAGRDSSQGVGFVVAHRPVAGGAARLSDLRIQLGGATATVTPRALGTSADDRTLARDLALSMSRAHAEALVADPGIGDAARLEVALRTRWAQTSDLEEVRAADSAVGFDPASERVQLMLPRVWGDMAVFVTFANDGTLRIEDFN